MTKSLVKGRLKRNGAFKLHAKEKIQKENFLFGAPFFVWRPWNDVVCLLGWGTLGELRTSGRIWGGLRTSGRLWVDCVPVGDFGQIAYQWETLGELRTSGGLWVDCVPSRILVSKIFTL